VPVGQPQALAEAILETLRNPPAPSMLEEAVERLQVDQAITAASTA
jgi:hypothetical protein